MAGLSITAKAVAVLWAVVPIESCPTPENRPASRLRRFAFASASILKSISAPDSLKITEPLLKSIVGSVAPALKVHTMFEPEPNVVVPISVVSRLMVIVSVAPPVVSMPLVPPATVKVLPFVIVWFVPPSPAASKEVKPLLVVVQSQVAVAVTHAMV